MEQTNTHPVGNSNSDRRVDSSRRRADAEWADEPTLQQDERALQQDEPALQQDEPEQPRELAPAEAATDPVWQRWREIQSNFVDDPRSSVAEAQALVNGAVDRVVQQLREQCRQLEGAWSNGKDTSTEDLRRCLQGYREFLGRLLETKPAA